MKPKRLGQMFIATTILPFLLACAALPSSTAPVQFSGDTLVNHAGMTLYTYDKDPAGKSACIGACAKNWPPLMATAQDKPGGAFTIIPREDGTRQWAYEGKPLYLWIKDAKPGEKTGQGVNKVWRTAERSTSMPMSTEGSDY